MGPFWTFARRMLRNRALAAAAMVMAVISACGMGAGLLGLVPILNNILGESHATLPDLARQFAPKIPSVILSQQEAEAWIARLPDGRFEAVLWIVLALGVMTVIGAAANFLHAYFSLTLTMRTIAGIRRAAFKHLVRLPLSVVVAGRGIDLSSRIVGDTNTLARGMQALTSKAVAQASRGAVALVVAFVVNWQLSAVMMLVSPLLALVIRKTGRRIRRASGGAMRGQANLLEDTAEVTQGFRIVKVFTAERAEIGRFTRHNDEVLAQSMRQRTASAIASPLLETITILALGGLALIAAKAIIDGELEATDFLVSLGSLGMAGAALRPLASVIHDVQAADAAAKRLMQLMSIEPEERRDPSRPRLARHRRSIEFQDVSFVYDGATAPAVNSINLRIDHGETVAFVGPNGCGKTTLLSLIPRLLAPTAGRVLVDGIDIAGVNLRSLRRQIGAVSQETTLFRGTIASNIAYGSPWATKERIEDAARRAHAHAFIVQQPKGYDTPVGESGLTLSGGQRQRLAIARALLRDPAILIMDEATSMIDSESEAQIAQAVSEMSGARTILIVAHRLTTVLSAGRIVVMDAGRIIDAGRHDDLIERCPLYRDLTRHQLMAGAR